MRFAVIAFCLLISLPSLPQGFPLGRHSTPEARPVVQRYCRHDYDGARFSKEGWTRLRDLTTWKDNPDWQSFTVVSQYEVSPADQGLRNARVAVQYTVLGEFVSGVGYVADRKTQVVEFRLKTSDEDWRIDSVEPPLNPHVSKARALAWLNGALATEKDAGKKAALQQAIKAVGGTVTPNDVR